MKEVYILVHNKDLELVLSNLLEIIGYLPIVVKPSGRQKHKPTKLKPIIITSYSYLHNNLAYLKGFTHIMVFVPYSPNLIEKDVPFLKNITYFNNTLTVQNLKAALEGIKI